MKLTGSLIFSYFDKGLAHNALEEWRSVMPHSDNQTTENFDYSIEEWLISLLPDNAFVSQKEWMTNMMRKPFTMKMKYFGNHLRTLNHLLHLMPCDHDKDSSFSELDLKALLLKSMPISWQHSYTLKGTHTSDDYHHMLSYIVQYQSMTDKSDTSAIVSTMGITGDRSCISNGHSRCGQFGQPPSQSHNRQKFNGNIPCKQNSGNDRPYIDYCGPCPVHPTLIYTWGDCNNNSRNKSAGG
jgi:hypothetical protein